MAWDVNSIYNFLLYQMKKNQAGGLKPADFQFAWNQEQSAYQSDLVGRWESQSNGKGGQETGIIQNETILTKLTPFTQTVTIPVTTGQATKPIDFVYALALRTNGTKIFQVDHDQVWFLAEDVIDPPSEAQDSYYYTEFQNYYAINPATVASMDLDYIQTVTDIIWGFDVQANGSFTYNAGASTQPKWGQNSIVDITKRCLKSLGVAFKDQDFAEFGNSNQKTGD